MPAVDSSIRAQLDLSNGSIPRVIFLVTERQYANLEFIGDLVPVFWRRGQRQRQRYIRIQGGCAQSTDQCNDRAGMDEHQTARMP
ncbi:hypothetical protein D3C84_933100 [compost metagenome]